MILQRRPRALPEERRGIGYGHRRSDGIHRRGARGRSQCHECAVEAELALVFNAWVTTTAPGWAWYRWRIKNRNSV